jgi:tRNA uridine 5-carbamoylmethylation protein Kti12
MSVKDTYRRLVEQSQSATDQAAETLKETREVITSRIDELKRRVGIDRNRITHPELKAVR